MVLCEACVTLATPVEMELAGPQSHLLLLALVGWLVIGEYSGCLGVVGVYLERGCLAGGDQPTNHPEQLASEDD